MSKPLSPSDIDNFFPDILIDIINVMIDEAWEQETKSAKVYPEWIDSIKYIHFMKYRLFHSMKYVDLSQNEKFIADVKKIYTEAGWKVEFIRTDSIRGCKDHFLFTLP